jgi:predicted alpha/beta-hydrolase family hydrolase
MQETNLILPSPTGPLRAKLALPDTAKALFVMGHGSGSHCDVPLMQNLAAALGARAIASLRLNYPYSDAPGFVPCTQMPPDPPKVLIETYRAAVALASTQAPALPLYVGGHSMSNIAASLADAASPLPAKALIALAYPRAGDPERSAHLPDTALPFLLIQGDADPLVSPDDLLALKTALGPRATTITLTGASHKFDIPGQSTADTTAQIAAEIVDYIERA